MIELTTDILQIIALALIGWRVFNRPLVPRYSVYYASGTKVMGVTSTGKQKLIHDAGEPVTGIAANHAGMERQEKVIEIKPCVIDGSDFISSVRSSTRHGEA